MAVEIHVGDCRMVLAGMSEQSVHCVVTSPPYLGLRDYGVDGQLGLEASLEDYLANMRMVFREVYRVLRDDGTLWLNLGDCYANYGRGGHSEAKRSKNWQPSYSHKKHCFHLKTKSLVGLPWRMAFALQEDGWILRSDIIWAKPNPMPESVMDRPTRAHEFIFLLSKSPRYHYDAVAIREPIKDSSLNRLNQDIDGQQGSGRVYGGGQAKPMKAVGQVPDKQRGHSRRHAGFNARWDSMSKAEQMGMGANKRTVWTVSTQPFPGQHFATFPPRLIEPCILAGCPAGGVVLDPFGGAGTTGLVADRLGRNAVLIELNPAYAAMAQERIRRDAGMFGVCRLVGAPSKAP